MLALALRLVELVVQPQLHGQVKPVPMEQQVLLVQLETVVLEPRLVDLEGQHRQRGQVKMDPMEQ